MTQRKVRCAIYTRKSTEEGLDQAFNSLDAQREACAAYVLSQAGEGWIVLPGRYDDGGFSGGNTDRPALQKLLADIDLGRVDVVVVYKIDRLTRSLADFAKIVERFEKRNASFVSVTQAFNTTSSMGRLTLNVLLSFAQFEREVTAERIRDKFSASRKKGIFMGGNPPLGYDARDRKLVVNAAEAETVRYIFQLYLDLSVSKLREELDAKGIRTKARTSTRGRPMGGGRWYIGPLRHVLRNRVYVGDAVHKGTAYPGEHEPIVDRELFEAVQAKLTDSRTSYHRGRTIGSHALLTGLIFDDRGNAMSPSRSQGRGGRYVYYVSQARLQRREPDPMRPVPASIVEGIVRGRLLQIIGARKPATRERADSSPEITDATLRELVRRLIVRIQVTPRGISVKFKTSAVADQTGLATSQIPKELRTRLPSDNEIESEGDLLRLTIPASLWIRGGIKRVEGWDMAASTKPRHDPTLIKALALATEWRAWIEKGDVRNLEVLAERTGLDRKRVHTILKFAFLAPDIQQAILANRVRHTVAEVDFHLLWIHQQRLVTAGV
jgi:DNA invertase Pin-like site-specific DNA recombinase